MRVEQRISGDVPARLARAAVYTGVLRVSVLVRVALLTVVVAALFGLGTASWTTAIVVVVVLPTALAVRIAMTTVSLQRALPGRGYRPGDTLTLDWSPESFTITTFRSTTTYRHDEIGWERRRNGAVVLFATEPKVLLLLPAAMLDAVRSGTAPITSAG